MTKQCIILIGVPGSGKSTFTREIEKSVPGVSVFSLDTCRLNFFTLNYQNEQEWDSKTLYQRAFEFCVESSKQFDEYVNLVWKDSLNSNIVLVDNTNLSRKSRSRWIQDARAKKFEVSAINFLCSIDTAIGRQLIRRDKKIDESIIREMYYRLQEPMVGTEVDVLYSYCSELSPSSTVQARQFIIEQILTKI